MTRDIKRYLDYIPLIILIVSAILLILTAANSEIILVWRHYIALILLATTIILFFIRHLFGVLSLGVVLLFGLIGILSFSPAITTGSFEFGGFKLLSFQPIFLLWLVIYFIVCWRHIVGIGTTKYWNEVKNKAR